MKTKHTTIVNYNTALESATKTVTSVNQTFLHDQGDYALEVFRLNPHEAQKDHFHTYGDIDVFMVVEGRAKLHLSKVENDKIVPGSEEILDVKAGDTYCVRPYTLHSLKTADEPVVVLNVAPGNHSAPATTEKYQRSVDIFFPKG